jgi:uncharacterized membrane protein
MMLKIRNAAHFREIIFCAIIIGITVLIALIPMSKYYNRPGTNREARCEVLRTDNSFVFQRGIFHQGEQSVQVRILDGPERGQQITAANLLQGAIELEWLYKPGDIGLLGYSKNGNAIVAARMLEPLREGPMLAVFLTFIGALLLLAGWVGVKSIVSFAFTIMVIWKVLLPVSLEGKLDPVVFAMFIVGIICFVTIFLVAGFNKKGLGAFLGSLGGCLCTLVILYLFGGPMKVNGAISSFSATLRYSGYEHLDLLKLFYAAVILSATGAIMDVAMDIAVAMFEIKEKKPDIGRWELTRSGFNIGRAVIGTMSTTLLLAYSGGALTMLMYLMAKGISIWRITNMNYVASEMLRTLSGTIGLTLVVPCTAIISGLILAQSIEKSRTSASKTPQAPLKIFPKRFMRK